MRFGTPARLLAAIGFGLALLLVAPALSVAADKDKDKDKEDKGKRVTFPTSDGVDIGGTFYAAPKDSKKEACVLLLHDFSGKKGGDSHTDDMDKLAEELQEKGYDVLSFDFRGFGESKNIRPEVFWTFNSSKLVIPQGFNPKSPPGNIDQKTFPAAYYAYLVNDVSAAKAYLDQKSQDKKLNSANVIVIGAGQGATVGNMWMFAQYRLRREKGLKPGGRMIDWDEPEGKDIAAGLWLTMSPQLEGVTIPITRYLDELEKTYRVPMWFVYGEQDKKAEEQTAYWLKTVMPDYKLLGDGDQDGKAHPDKKLKLTRDFCVKDTKLAGSKLLNDLPNTTKAINFFVDRVMEERGIHPPRHVEVDKFPYAWIDPRTGAAVPAKAMNEEGFKPLDLRVIYLGNR